jgi:hypothetical protein
VRRKLPRNLDAARLARDMSAQKKLSKFDPMPFLLEERWRSGLDLQGNVATNRGSRRRGLRPWAHKSPHVRENLDFRWEGVLLGALRRVFVYRNTVSTYFARFEKKISFKLRGHYQYYGRPTNYQSIWRFSQEVRHIWRKWLSRRTRAKEMTGETFVGLLRAHPLLPPRILHSWHGAGRHT